METEQADRAVLPVEAAPTVGAENVRERVKSRLLNEMSLEAPAGGEMAVSIEYAADGAAAPDEQGKRDELEGAGLSSAEEEGGEGHKAKNFRGRWDHLNDQDRRVVELTTKRGLTLTEAMRAVYGGREEAPAQAKAEGGDLDVQIEQHQARVEELRQKKTEAKGDLEAYDHAAEAYIEAREALHGLRLQRQQVASAEEARVAKVRAEAEMQAKQGVVDEFPDAVTPGTELHEAFAEEMAYLRESNSPLVQDPQVEYKVARRLARVMGWRQAAPEVALVPKRTVRPVPVGGGAVEVPAVAMERRLAGARSPGAMLELMREIGTPIEALLRKN